MENNFDKFLDRFQELRESEVSFVVCTMVGSVGSAPQDTGARFIVSENGIEFGTIGGGKVENRSIEFAKEFLQEEHSPNNKYVEWNLQKDIGMTCGGVVKLFFEIYRREANWNIAIFGAGHVSQELCRLLLRLNCKLTCIDNRQEWLDKLPEDKNFKKVCLSEMKEYVHELKEDHFVALMTMGHAKDSPILAEILKTKKLPYLGVIGSKVKRVAIEKDLRDLGVATASIKEFICPIGEKLGKNSPSEIAISIAAQLLKYRDNFYE